MHVIVVWCVNSNFVVTFPGTNNYRRMSAHWKFTSSPPKIKPRWVGQQLRCVHKFIFISLSWLSACVIERYLYLYFFFLSERVHDLVNEHRNVSDVNRWAPMNAFCRSFKFNLWSDWMSIFVVNFKTLVPSGVFLISLHRKRLVLNGVNLICSQWCIPHLFSML